MVEFLCPINFPCIIAILTLTAKLASFSSVDDICNQYGYDICRCHQDPRCILPRGRGYCVGVDEVCKKFPFTETTCRINGEVYVRNQIACKYEGSNVGICTGRRISFSKGQPLDFHDFTASEEFNEIYQLSKSGNDVVSNSGLQCLVYTIPVKKSGNYHISLQKRTGNFQGSTLDVLVNGIVVLHGINAARFSVGQKIHINYGVVFNKIGEALLSMNRKPMLRIKGKFVQVKVCPSLCSNEPDQSVDYSGPHFLKLVDVVQFKPQDKKRIRKTRGLGDLLNISKKLDLNNLDLKNLKNIKLDVGLDAKDPPKKEDNPAPPPPAATKKSKKAKKSSEENDEEKSSKEKSKDS